MESARSRLQRALIARLAVLGLTALFGKACQNAPADLADAEALIFVKASSNSYLNVNFISRNATSNLYKLSPISPNGKVTNLTNLTAPGAAVADPEISYDGLRVLFSMRRNQSDSWNIFEMSVDGTNLRQLTSSNFDDCDPTYLPNGRIMFSSNRPGFLDEYERRPVELLHVMDADGSNIEQVSFNMSDDFDPVVLRDGRIAWTRWEHHGTQNRFPLFFTQPDGQSTFLHFGPHNRNFWHARELEDGKMVAIMSDRVQVDRGQLVILHADRTTADALRVSNNSSSGELSILTPHINVSGDTSSFKYPAPLPDGRLVVSYAPRGHNAGEYGLYTIARDGSGLSLLYNDPATNELDAVVVMPRPVPQVIPESVNRAVTTGVFLNQNVYNRQQRDGQEIPKPGEVRQVMIVEAIPQLSRHRNPFTSFESKRIIGTAPVHEDGSFAIEVPANTPFSINLLDSLGRAIVIKRSWLYARPGENFDNCTGCHGERGQSSGNPNPKAASLPPSNLVVPVEQRQVIAFRNAIAPIIEQKCLSCHNAATPGGGLDLTLEAPPQEENGYPVAYQQLLRDHEPRLVEVNRVPFARRSYLVNYLLGLGDRAGSGPHPADENSLSSEEIRKIITWIDLGGQYQ